MKYTKSIYTLEEFLMMNPPKYIGGVIYVNGKFHSAWPVGTEKDMHDVARKLAFAEIESETETVIK